MSVSEQGNEAQIPKIHSNVLVLEFGSRSRYTVCTVSVLPFLPSLAHIAAGLGALVNVSVQVEQSILRGQLGEVSVQDDLHTAGCEANNVTHAEGKSLWRRPPALLS